MGLYLLAYAWNTEGYGFVEFEISNSTSSTVFCQPLTTASCASTWKTVRTAGLRTSKCASDESRTVFGGPENLASSFWALNSARPAESLRWTPRTDLSWLSLFSALLVAPPQRWRNLRRGACGSSSETLRQPLELAKYWGLFISTFKNCANLSFNVEIQVRSMLQAPLVVSVAFEIRIRDVLQAPLFVVFNIEKEVCNVLRAPLVVYFDDEIEVHIVLQPPLSFRIAGPREV